jgi:hypothetical protein
MQRADGALYAAKKGGRDQVRVATEAGDEAAGPRAVRFSGRD